MREVSEGGSVSHVGFEFWRVCGFKHGGVVVSERGRRNLGEGVEVAVTVDVADVITDRRIDVVEDARCRRHVRTNPRVLLTKC